ncbi:MAG TPA: DUF2231 domain-containing protein [Conexibacter sp.]|nr:DUF2231 domain-containing protein [Conexibacter sp.]
MTANTPATLAPDARRPLLTPGRALIALTLGYLVCITLLGVEPDRAFGLPAHPLLVHLPVVLIPLLVIAAIALTLKPAWRARYGLAVGLLVVGALASTVLAAGAGEQLLAHEREQSALIHDHQEAADTLRLLMFALTGILLLTLARDWYAARAGRAAVLGGRAVAVGLAAVTLVLAGATGFFVVRTGHLGAKATWQQEGGSGAPESDGD